MKKWFGFLLIGLLVQGTGFLPGTAIAEDKQKEILVFATPEKEGLLTRYQRGILKEISARTCIACTLKELPKKRCLVGANRGRYAGLAGRVQCLETEYPNLRMIRVSHVTVQHILFAKRRDIFETVHDIKSLNKHMVKTGCVVGFLRGSKKANHLLSELPKENIYALKCSEQGFKMLYADRIEAYLGGPGIVNRTILKEQFHQTGIHEVCVLSKTPLFPYVHVKYASLIPRLEAALQSMADDGTMDSIRKSLK
jgi:hypothetical protein